VLPTDSPDHPGGSGDGETPPRWAEPPVRRKESVARMALSGLGYVITVSKRQLLKFQVLTFFLRLFFFKRTLHDHHKNNKLFNP
jgi:hypothetical protein